MVDKHVLDIFPSTLDVEQNLICFCAAEPDAIERDQEECGYKLHGQAGAWIDIIRF